VYLELTHGLNRVFENIHIQYQRFYYFEPVKVRKMPRVRKQAQHLRAARNQRNSQKKLELEKGLSRAPERLGDGEMLWESEDEDEESERRLNDQERCVEVHFLDFDSEWEEEEEEEEEEYTDWEEEVDTDFDAGRGAGNGETGEERRLLDRLKGVEASVFDTARI